MPLSPEQLAASSTFQSLDRGAQLRLLKYNVPEVGNLSPVEQEAYLDQLNGRVTAGQPTPQTPPQAAPTPQAPVLQQPQMPAAQPTPEWYKNALATVDIGKADFLNAASLGYGDDIERNVTGPLWQNLTGMAPDPRNSMDPNLVRQYWQQQGATPFAPQIPLLNVTPAKFAGDLAGFNVLGRLPFLNQMKGIPKLAAEGAAYGALAQPEGQDSLQARLGNALSMGAGGAAFGVGGKILGKVARRAFNAAREFVQGPVGFDGVRTLQAGVRERVNAAQQMADPQMQQEVLMRLRAIQEAVTQQGGNAKMLEPLAKRLQKLVTQKQLNQYSRFIQRMENMLNVQAQSGPRGVGSGGQLQPQASVSQVAGAGPETIEGAGAGAQGTAGNPNQAVAPEGTGAGAVASGGANSGGTTSGSWLQRTLEGVVKQYGFDTVDDARNAVGNRVLKTARQAKTEISAETDPVRLRDQLLKAAAELGEDAPAGLRKTLAAKIKKLNSKPTPIDIAGANQLLDETNLRLTKLRASKLDNEPNLTDVLKSEFDAKTGIGKQIPNDGSLLTLDQIKPALYGKGRYGPKYREYARIIEQAAAEGKPVKFEYDAEAVGHTSRGGRQQEFTPLGFGLDKNENVLIKGYNENGHFTTLHLHELKGKKGQLPTFGAKNEAGEKTITGFRNPSAIVSTPEILDKPGFVGPRAGAYKKTGAYKIEDALNVPSREETIAKRDLDKVSMQASLAMDNILQQGRAAELPEAMLTKLADVAKGRGAEVSDFKAIKRYLENNKVLKIMCSILNLGQKAS